MFETLSRSSQNLLNRRQYGIRHLQTSFKLPILRRSDICKKCSNCQFVNYHKDIVCVYCEHDLSDVSITKQSVDDFIRLACSAKDIITNSAAAAAPSTEILRVSRNAVVVKFPYPYSCIHISSIARYSKQRWMLQQLNRRDFAILPHLKAETLKALPNLLPPYLKELKQHKLLKLSLIGLIISSPYRVLHLHLVVPPIFNFNIFKNGKFVPLDFIMQQLAEEGCIRSNAWNPTLAHAILENVRYIDQEIRSLQKTNFC